MLIVVSPAKTLDYETPLPAFVTPTQPHYISEASELIDVLKSKPPAEIASLMSLSDKLASLNVLRYNDWQPSFSSPDARPALFAFKGDVYTGLDVSRFSADDLKQAQEHLRILSGLYGLLRPLDYMRPYRLEMGTDLANPRGKNLYEFWGDRLTEAVNAAMAEQGDKVLINLASQEYFRAIQPKKLNGRLITPQFRDEKNGQFKIISFFAKKARGRMAAWLIQERISTPEALLDYSVDGYRYDAGLSRSDAPVFTRREADKGMDA
ncbi:MAG: peroxide stress protein YaaA [Paraperlucidibaca sp.]